MNGSSADVADSTCRFILNVTCASAQGQVAAVVGFLDGFGCYIDECSVFDDPQTDRWETLRPMPKPAGGLAGAAANGKLYVFGGESPRDVIAECWCYDPASDRWTAGPPMRTPRHGLAGVAVKGRIYAVGGGLKPSGGQVCAINEVLIG